LELVFQSVLVVPSQIPVAFKVMVTVKVDPVQLPEVGVTVYVAVCAVFVGLVSVPLIFDAPLPDVPPVIPPVTDGAGQL
jgi:hypothetical protein